MYQKNPFFCRLFRKLANRKEKNRFPLRCLQILLKCFLLKKLSYLIKKPRSITEVFVIN